MCSVRNGNLLKSRVSEICVKRICVNHGVGVHQRTFLAWKIKSAQGICHFAKDCTYKEQMRSAHVLARMIDRNAAQRANLAKKVHKPPLWVNVIDFELNGLD